jgi:glutaconyl-CoA/methylmalonyl-CoA decarboxylase subunit gamma
MLEKFLITIDGQTHEVLVEKVPLGAVARAPQPAVAQPVTPDAAPAPLAVAAASAPPIAVAAGETPVNAPMPGKIVKIVAKVGQKINKGDILMILEAMKMQNEIGSPVAGTVKSIAVATGGNVKPGDLMAVIA